VHNQVFNVGRSDANYRVKEIAEVVAATFPGCSLSFGKNDKDNRSYRVSFDKINSRLPGFRCAWDLESGAKELRDVFERINMTREQFEFRAFTRLKQLNHLKEGGKLDAELFWR
jgi:nucleoside-diphosphate-sugar epimerase